MALKLILSNQFKKDLKRISLQNKNLKLMNQIVDLLANQDDIPIKNKDHKLTGNYLGYRELHIQPDWLLIYKITTTPELILARTGSHSELF